MGGMTPRRHQGARNLGMERLKSTEMILSVEKDTGISSILLEGAPSQANSVS
jgi:hypothetical protein